MSKMNIDQSLDDIVSNNITKFSGMRKTRDGKVVLDRRQHQGGGGHFQRRNYRRDGKQRNYNNFNNRGGAKSYYNDGRGYRNNFRGGGNDRDDGNRYHQAKRAFRYRDQRDGLGGGYNGIKLQTNPNITKMHISNLDFGVSQGDMKELFTSIGRLKHVSLHYDKNGRSQGTCEIIFERKHDALKAFNQYNGVPLDGRPMCLELMGEPVRDQRDEDHQREPRRPRENNRNEFRNGGNRRDQRKEVNAEDLDKELDAYLSNKTPKEVKAK